MKIKAALTQGLKAPFALEEVDLSEPNENEILVKMAGVGICHTDLFFRDLGIPQAVLGHEGSGIVEKVGNQVTKVRPGDTVVLTFASCGECGSCQGGEMAYCFNFERLNNSGARTDGSPTLTKDGKAIFGNFFGQSSFANYALATERNVIKVSKEAPLELLGPMGCGFQTGAGSVINSLRPKSGQSIAIFGAGAVGLSAILGAELTGCSEIIAVDINPERLKLTETVGATHTINPKEKRSSQCDP